MRAVLLLALVLGPALYIAALALRDWRSGPSSAVPPIASSQPEAARDVAASTDPSGAQAEPPSSSAPAPQPDRQSPEVPAAVGTTGVLEVRTEPSGADVTVDGEMKGRAPLIIADLKPGEHEVRVARGASVERRRVEVRAAETARLVIPIGPRPEPAPATGFLSVRAPIELRILEGSRAIGTSLKRVALSPGRRTITLANDEVGFREARSVVIEPGEVLPLRVALPDGRLAVNAMPWAEVWLDGTRVGDTPLGNIVTAVGMHRLVFRHPELGERTATALVKVNEPARVSVDMRK